MAAQLMAIDCPCDQLLAGPALAEDQHRHIQRGHPTDLLANLADERRSADDPLRLRIVW
jgi:hypothetical protein